MDLERKLQDFWLEHDAARVGQVPHLARWVDKYGEQAFDELAAILYPKPPSPPAPPSFLLPVVVADGAGEAKPKPRIPKRPSFLGRPTTTAQPTPPPPPPGFSKPRPVHVKDAAFFHKPGSVVLKRGHHVAAAAEDTASQRQLARRSSNSRLSALLFGGVVAPPANF